jgi:cytochrome b561
MAIDYMVEKSTGSVAVRYKPIVVWIHWITALLVITQVVIGWTFFHMPKGPERMDVFAWHKTIGATILILALIRLGVRLINPPPPFPADLPKWERFLAVWNHRLFYFLLIALPLTGLAAVSGHATDGLVALRWGLHLPAIPGISPETGDEMGDVHIVLVFTTIALLVLHIGAALKQQFIGPRILAGRMPPFQAPDDAKTITPD